MKGKISLGLLLVAAGLLIALEQLGVLAAIGLDGRIIWPVLGMVAGGVVALAMRNAVFGTILFLISLFRLLDFWIEIKGSLVVPVILVVVGLELVFGSLRKKPLQTGSAGAQELEAVAVFGGVERKIISQDFKGGTAIAVFGAVELDLTGIALQQTAVLEANAVFGGVEIRLPAGIPVKNELHAFLGGVENHLGDTAPMEGQPMLILRGAAVFGAVELK